MKEALIDIINHIAKLIDVKSIVTLAMTATLIAMLVGAFSPAQEFVALYCTSYGAIMTYYFTRKEKPESKPESNE